MKKSKKWLTCLSVLLMFCLVLSGCAKTSSTQTTAPTTEQPKEVTITDHANRTVTIPAPDQLKKVYFTSPLGMIYVYTLTPDKLAGTSMKLTASELKYMPGCKDLPYLGGVQAGAELNKEAIIKAGAQIIISISPDAITDNDKTTADQLQQQLNIPVVCVDGDLQKADKAYEFLGKILGQEKRAAQLSAYCTKVFKDVVDKVSAIPEKDRVKVYYAEQSNGLSTDPDTSSHAAVLKYANALNVATVQAKGGSGMSPVSLEQVLSWNPDVIISWGDNNGGAYNLIKSSKDWANINAVKNNRVYQMPDEPFSWIDRPPSVNRFLGIQWVANLLYPNVYKVDIKKETKDFYKLFYNIDLSDADVNSILKNALPQ